MRHDRIIGKLTRSRFLVTMSDGAAFTGVLWDTDRMSLQLKDAAAVQPDGSRVKADSDLFLPRARVAYLQLLSE